MNLKIAEQICKYQGIKKKVEVKVYCPRCGKKTLLLNITDDEAYCIRCDKYYHSVTEVLKIEEERWLEKHEASKYMMQDNKGVGY